jgi:hypothetical protein
MRIVALAALAFLVAAFALPDSVFVAVARAASAQTTTSTPKALFLAFAHTNAAVPNPTGQLAQWNGGFTDNTKQAITYVMVGSDPNKTNVTTTIPVVIIPIKMVFGSSNGNMTFDPLTVKLKNGQTLMQNVLASPLFTPSVKYVQGGTNVGQTQYIDAFQRANFWNAVSTHTKYHVLLGKPTILPEQTIVVPQQDGSVTTNPFGSKPVGTMFYNDFDTAIQGIIANLKQINPTVLPLFVSYDTFLTEAPAGEGCCIGGYHSALGSPPVGQTPTNAQTYAYTTYEDEAGSFSEDIAAMSHEVGEWMDDPFVDNSVNCADNQIMEDGDPLENNPNNGTFPYTVNGFTYHPQSLVFLDYFGAPPVTDLHSWYSFQNDEVGPCPGQNVAITPPSGNLPLGL